ncbi:MAG: TIGR02530 family flagellar biosynthesis protein [Lachnospiraceae bacterium]
MQKIQNPFTSIEQVQNQYPRQQTKRAEKEVHSSFAEILNQQQKKTDSTGLKFSKHAEKRLSERNITLSAQQKSRLETGVLKASEKGINESLIMMDSLAFIVNVPNRTVVTAMDQMESYDSIFTNIDGAVIV